MVHEGDNQVSTSGAIPSYTYLVIYLNKPLSVNDLINRVLTRSTSTLEEARESLISMLKDDEDGTSMVGFKYSLLDPLTYQRMEHPVRSSHCKHVKCFDLRGFVELYSNKEKMECPVCYEPVRFDELKEDTFVLSILKDTTKDEEEVELELTGEWHHCPVQVTPPPSPPPMPLSYAHSNFPPPPRFINDFEPVPSRSRQIDGRSQSRQSDNTFQSRQAIPSSRSKQADSNQPRRSISNTTMSPFDEVFPSFLDDFCSNRRKRRSLNTPSIDSFFANKRDAPRSQEVPSITFPSTEWDSRKYSSASTDIIDLCDDSSDEQTCNSRDDCIISLVD